MKLTPSLARSLLAFAPALAAVALAAFTTGALAQPLTKVKFQLDWRFEGPAALFLVPKAKGYFQQEGLDVTIDSGNGSAGAVNRVASGAYEMGFADVSAMIEFLGNNPSGAGAGMQAVFMVYDVTPAAVLALKKSGIRTVKDLNGRKFGAPVFDAGRKAFPVFVQANRLDGNSIKWTSMDPPLRETMLARGEVEAITGFYFTSLLNLNARGVKDEDVVVFKYPDHGVKLYGNAVIVNGRFAQENPKAVAAFLRALSRGIKDTIADPAAAIQTVRERDPLIDVALETRRLRLAIDSVIATPNFRQNGIGAIDPARFGDTVSAVVGAYQLKSFPNPLALFNSAYMPEKPVRMVFGK
jgi:NitT/TauT family transport system substrate-binding protein